MPRAAVKPRCLIACFLLLATFGQSLNAQQRAALPNIIYILADDLGYGDIGAYNPDSKIATPHLDRLAAEGMRFRDAHSPSSVCTPTRYSILTGRYPWRSRKPVGVLRGYSRTLIEPDRATVAKLLKGNGYHTAVVGKWHLGLDWALPESKRALAQTAGYGIDEEMLPDDIDFEGAITGGPHTAGFDYSYVLPASLDMPPYCYVENQTLTELPTDSTAGSSLDSGYTGAFWRPGKKAPSFDFLNVFPSFVSKARQYIDTREPGTPFFLYLPLPAPHTPWLPDAAHRGRSGAGEYGDFVQQVDAAVGELLSALSKKGMAENTLVIFTSDNGPFWREAHAAEFGHRAAGPFRGMKADAYEGGHRIPFIARWPGHIAPGAASDATTTLANLMATCADLVGERSARYSTEDSYSLLPVLTGKAQRVAREVAVVHSASNGALAIRSGDWKLIEGLGSGGFTEPREMAASAGGPAGQLYNLADDPGETTNLYQQFPAKVAELSQLLGEIKRK